MKNIKNNKRTAVIGRDNTIKKSALVLTVFISLIVVLFITKNNSYAAPEQSGRTICYRAVLVEQGDSLWSIAEDNMTQEWGNTGNYVNEIKKLNNMTDAKILTGSYISIPYYANIQ